jgi:hypothetical protein
MKDLNDIGKYQLTAVINSLDADPTVTFCWRHTFFGTEEWVGDRKLTIPVCCHGQDVRGSDCALSAQA